MSAREAPDRLDSKAVHALSNQIAVILGFVELVLAETPLDDPRCADLIEIRDAAVQASNILGRPVGPSE